MCLKFLYTLILPNKSVYVQDTREEELMWLTRRCERHTERLGAQSAKRLLARDALTTIHFDNANMEDLVLAMNKYTHVWNPRFTS